MWERELCTPGPAFSPGPKLWRAGRRLPPKAREIHPGIAHPARLVGFPRFASGSERWPITAQPTGTSQALGRHSGGATAGHVTVASLVKNGTFAASEVEAMVGCLHLTV